MFGGSFGSDSGDADPRNGLTRKSTLYGDAELAEVTLGFVFQERRPHPPDWTGIALGFGSRRHLPGCGSLTPDPPLGRTLPVLLALRAAGPRGWETFCRWDTRGKATPLSRAQLAPLTPDSDPRQIAGLHCCAPDWLPKGLGPPDRIIVLGVVERVKWNNGVRRHLLGTGL